MRTHRIPAEAPRRNASTGARSSHPAHTKLNESGTRTWCGLTTAHFPLLRSSGIAAHRGARPRQGDHYDAPAEFRSHGPRRCAWPRHVRRQCAGRATNRTRGRPLVPQQPLQGWKRSTEGMNPGTEPRHGWRQAGSAVPPSIPGRQPATRRERRSAGLLRASGRTRLSGIFLLPQQPDANPSVPQRVNAPLVNAARGLHHALLRRRVPSR